MTCVPTDEITELTVLAARAKTKVKLQGRLAITTLSYNEIRAMALVLDVLLEDHIGAIKQAQSSPAHQPII